MTYAQNSRYGAVRRRIAATLVALALLVAGASAIGSVSKADAWTGVFCNGYVAPYGQAGDRCAAPAGNYASTSMAGYGVNHSICIDAYDQYGNLISSWQCSGGPGVTVQGYFGSAFQSARGVARNNTTGDSTNIYACQQYC